MAAKAGSIEKSDGQGHFFAVERAAWALVCQRGSMNEAVAYLILARGSHFGTRLTSWSIHSIEEYTEISRPRAKLAIEGLRSAGLIVRTRAGTNPQYYLPTAAEVERMYAPGMELSEAEWQVFELVKTKGAVTFTEDDVFPTGSADAPSGAEIADELDRRGLLLRGDAGEYFTNPSVYIVPKPEWIWLPNSLVDGIARRDAPVEQVRQMQNLLAFRLLVDLYFWQSLAFDSGLRWTMVREEFEKVRVGASGPYVVWGFRSTGMVLLGTPPFIEPYLTGESVRVKGPDGIETEFDTGIPVVSAALRKLTDMGLIRPIPHLIDADTDEGEVIHPCPVEGGEKQERAITQAALAAADRLITDGQARRADGKGMQLMLPLLKHVDAAQVVGMLRLTHRARTAATADWARKLEGMAKWVIHYDQIGPKA